ncbi:MAG: helix-turn-helix transcriptional regulator [Paludibacteraceae bacterium]|nr:helix-turn-helix transcriptional regulator [Prevotellaceae bacterium]
MKNRIAQIIEKENLTSAKFAYMIGIQPSAVSHILSGRNNASTDVLQKIMRAYPSISSEWLLLGIGDMYKKAPEPVISQKIELKTGTNKPQMLSLFGDELGGGSEKTKENEEKPESTAAPICNAVKSAQETQAVPQPVVSPPVSEASNPSLSIQQMATASVAQHSQRTIRKIIILYSDNTFEEINNH